MDGRRGRKLLIGCFGCLDAVNLHAYVVELRHAGFEITLWLSQEAMNFVHPAVLKICGADVIVDDGPNTWGATRPSALVDGKDMMVLLPCTANTIAQIANGLSGNRLLTCLLSFTGPVVIFPSMGSAMWRNAAVVDNVARIKRLGYQVCEPPLTPSLSGGEHRGLPTPLDVRETLLGASSD